jgi:predicted methyltransferase
VARNPAQGIENEGFKLNKIGTGEGAQAYGHGIYFAGNRDVSESYRKGLSIENKGYPVVEIDGIPLHTSDPNSSLSSPFDSSDVTRPITGEEAKQMLEAASRENWDKSEQAADDAVRSVYRTPPLIK